MREKKCCWCPKFFDPDVRLKERQRSCGSAECKRKQKLSSHRHWKKNNRQTYLENQRDWQKNHPDYWKEYRKKNVKYAERNRVQSRIRKRLLKLGLQKRIDILEVTEKTMEYWNLPQFAKHPRSLVPILWAYDGVHGNTVLSGLGP